MRKGYHQKVIASKGAIQNLLKLKMFTNPFARSDLYTTHFTGRTWLLPTRAEYGVTKRSMINFPALWLTFTTGKNQP
jgi:hypothetical protein